MRIEDIKMIGARNLNRGHLPYQFQNSIVMKIHQAILSEHRKTSLSFRSATTEYHLVILSDIE
jgi:hypothetical protein